MSVRPQTIRDATVGAMVFALAAISILTTSFDTGLAYLWLPNAYLITILSRLPRRQWTAPMLWSAGGTALATGLFGLGWMMAPAMALANSAEALVAAYLMRRAHTSLLAFGSPRWSLQMLWAAGIAGPVAMALVAMLPIWLYSGQQPLVTIVRAIAGHGLANFTFIPVVKLFVTGSSELWRQPATTRSRVPLTLLFALQLVVTLAVFVQSHLPLLFLPILPVVAIVFIGRSRATALSLTLLAAIGGAFTLMGRGPIQLAAIPSGIEMQFLQFYLFATVMTVVPIAVKLRSRARLVRQVHNSEARYRMLADHSSDIITHTDLAGRLLFASTSMARIAGYGSRELNGRSLPDLIDPRDHAKVRERYEAAIQAGSEAVGVEFRAQVRDVAWRWFESWCRGVVGKDGQVESPVNIVRDISERKQRDEQLAIAALTDPLIGLPNRRAFRNAADDENIEQRSGETA